MRLLVDTQCWLWMAASPERLSSTARGIVEDPANHLLLSSASAWEIAIKYALGKLQLPDAPARYVPTRMVALRTRALPIEHAHALGVSDLPPHHRDPFDRLLVSQALGEGIPLLTADPTFGRYGVSVVDA